MLSRKKRSIKASVFEISYDDATILPSNKWAVYVNFQILAENERRVHSEKIYTLICSPLFEQEPEDELIDEKTVVMDYLNKKEIEAKIRSTIEKINNLQVGSWEEYYRELEKHFHIED